MIAADWIAADWGTSNLRVWAIGADGAVLAEAGSDDGMGRLAPEAFEPDRQHQALVEFLFPELCPLP